MDYTMGEITLFSFPFTPTGWMSCEGQIGGEAVVSKDIEQQLGQLIGK